MLGKFVSRKLENGTNNICWAVTDGTPGMQNQALGLAERLGLPIAIKRVGLRRPWNFLAPHFFWAALDHLTGESDPLIPPWPAVAVGCGRQSIPFMRALKRASRGRTVIIQCQHPRVSIGAFDLVVPPDHDGLTGPNVLPILGSPNRISPQALVAAREQFARFEKIRGPRIAVLVGGNNKAYRFGRVEAEAMARALSKLSGSHGLMITASRRTGAENMAIIRKALENSDAMLWDGSGENPYHGLLAWADAFIVTADSVNMACEAAGTGKPVHIFPLPGGSKKFHQFHRALEKRGIARVFRGEIEHWTYPKLDETGRAAAAVLKLLDLSRAASDMKAEG